VVWDLGVGWESMGRIVKYRVYMFWDGMVWRSVAESRRTCSVRTKQIYGTEANTRLCVSFVERWTIPM
jgi:hypothetical protein